MATGTIYYDPIHNSYMIPDASAPGGWRTITVDQASAYTAQGWQTRTTGQQLGPPPVPPSGTFTGQMGPPPVPNNPATGPGTGPPVPPPSPAPTPPAPPAAPTGWGQTPNQTDYGWGTGWHGSTAGPTSPFADLTGVQQAYYQQHPDQANSLLRQWLAPQANSAYAQFINQRAPDMYNQFAAASTQPGNEGLQYTDWLKQNFGQLSNQFAGQSATQRGENPLSFGGGFAGRKAYM